MSVSYYYWYITWYLIQHRVFKKNASVKNISEWKREYFLSSTLEYLVEKDG